METLSSTTGQPLRVVQRFQVTCAKRPLVILMSRPLPVRRSFRRISEPAKPSSRSTCGSAKLSVLDRSLKPRPRATTRSNRAAARVVSVGQAGREVVGPAVPAVKGEVVLEEEEEAVPAASAVAEERDQISDTV